MISNWEFGTETRVSARTKHRRGGMRKGRNPTFVIPYLIRNLDGIGNINHEDRRVGSTHQSAGFWAGLQDKQDKLNHACAP